MANRRTKSQLTRPTFLLWVHSTPHDLTIYRRLSADAIKDSAILPTRLLVLSIRLPDSLHALHPRCQSCRKTRWALFQKDGHSSRPLWWAHLVRFRRTLSSLVLSVPETPRSMQLCVVTLVRQVAAQGR